MDRTKATATNTRNSNARPRVEVCSGALTACGVEGSVAVEGSGIALLV
jgi:hypothetical protein